MRQIKFRGKRLDNDEWVYGDLIHIDDSDIGIVTDYDHWQGCRVDPETVGQFSGLLDRNGKEIYEGDILCCKDDPDFLPETIEFDEGCFMAKDGYTSVPISTIDTRYRVIIGNIHDTPDLLNGK